MRSIRLTTTAACVAVVLLAAGCGGGEPGGEGPATPTASETDTAESPSEPTASSSPSVVPAEGPLVKHDVFSVHLPQGYELLGNEGMTKGGYDPALPGLAVLFEIENFGGIDLDQAARDSSRELSWDRAPERLDDVEIDGVTAYHLRGRSGGDREDEFGTVYQDTFARLIFSVRVKGATRERAIASILASWKWK